METFVAILAIILGVLGIIGSVIPALPGPPLGWLGLLAIYIWGGGTNADGASMSTGLLLLWLAITVIVTVLDYLIPPFFTKLTGSSKYAGWGAMAGLFIGLIFPPLGLILGTLLGAFVAELVFAEKNAKDSLKAAFGAFMGFLFGTGIKLVASAMMLYYIVVYGF
ncbi:MAG: DUF456 domain-containing protein [Bacteroidales bacterium]|nr:DUF456 domain-containing protein [Bacteroidales bacterium]